MSSPSLFGRTATTGNNISFTTNMTSSISRTNASSSSSSSRHPPLPTTVGGVSQTELEDLRQAFQLFDTEKKGKILLKDVRAVLESIMGSKTTTNNTHHHHRACGLSRVVSRIRALPDSDNNNTLLNMEEFIQLMTQPDPNDKRSEMRKVFDLFDVDRKGFINVEDLGRVAADLGEGMDHEELQEMIQRASSASSSGKVYPQDFEAVMNKKLFS